jgi:hypothetical protein
MAHIGNPECCCEEESECPECCTPAKLFIYMQYNQVDNLDYTCDECPAEPFLVEIDAVDCGEEPSPFVAPDPADYCELSDDECAAVTFENCTPNIGDPSPPSINCVTSCFCTSFSSPCIECTPTMGGSNVYLKSEYEIYGGLGRVTTGSEGGTQVFQCAVLIYLIVRTYAGPSCESMNLTSTRFYSAIIHDPVNPGGLEECCDATFGFGWTLSCTILCDTFFSNPNICTAGTPPGDIDHPEWSEVEFIC